MGSSLRRRIEEAAAKRSAEDELVAAAREAAHAGLEDPETSAEFRTFCEAKLAAPNSLLGAYTREVLRSKADGRGLDPEASPELWRLREEIVRLVDSEEAARVRVRRDLVLCRLKFLREFPRAIVTPIYHHVHPSGTDLGAVAAARERVDAYRKRRQAAVARIIEERERGLRDGSVEPVTDWDAAGEPAEKLAQQSYRTAGWHDRIDEIVSDDRG